MRNRKGQLNTASHRPRKRDRTVTPAQFFADTRKLADIIGESLEDAEIIAADADAHNLRTVTWADIDCPGAGD